MQKWIVSIALLILAFKPLYSCTDFVIQNKEMQPFNGRSLDFAPHLPWQIVIQGAGESVQSIAPGKLPGIKWVSRYSYMGMSCSYPDFVVDGMNEKGLSFAALLFPTGQYQSVPFQNKANSLAYDLLGKWILGNFASVNEVKEAIQKIYVWKGNLPPELSQYPLHYAIHDTSGNSLVIEYVQGKLNVYDNPVQVMTNYPSFDWQLTNLENYTALRALNAPPLVFKGKKVTLKGQGSGFTGMPGDYTPASRFIRLAYSKYFAKTPVGVNPSISLAFHLLNTVDIPYGVVKSRTPGPNNVDYTRWVVVKDLTHQVLYWKTYENVNVFRLSLEEANPGQDQLMGPFPIDQPINFKSISTK